MSSESDNASRLLKAIAQGGYGAQEGTVHRSPGGLHELRLSILGEFAMGAFRTVVELPAPFSRDLHGVNLEAAWVDADRFLICSFGLLLLFDTRDGSVRHSARKRDFGGCAGGTVDARFVDAMPWQAGYGPAASGNVP